MTDCDRLLSALSDGCEHEARELYRLGMIVHSRAADLRRKGHRIECRKTGGEYFYRIVKDVAGANEVAEAPGERPTPTDETDRSVRDPQFTLWDAA